MPESDFVMLESEDGYTFVVPRKVACASGTLRSMLDEDGESGFHNDKTVCFLPHTCWATLCSMPGAIGKKRDSY